MERPDLVYPCQWEYRVIGREEALRDAIKTILNPRTFELKESATSATGKYASLRVLVTVESEEDRLRLFRELGAHPAVKFVL